ncbi:MAG: hypothetical protein ACE5FN_10375 [Leptospirillia bacterium]
MVLSVFRAPRRAARFAPLLLLALVLMPASTQAAFLGSPNPRVGLYQFHHGVDIDYTERKVTSSRWTPELTFRNVRLTARETYGMFAWRDILVNVSGLFGISRAEMDFGAVDMGDGGTFWNTYDPGGVAVGAVRDLKFGENFGSTWGGALHARFFKLNSMQVAGGAQIMYSSSSDSGLPAMRLRYNEWDAFLGIEIDRPFLSFYTGANMSWLVGELKLPDRATDIDQKDLIGVYMGMGLKFYRHMDFHLEVRLLNQNSLSGQLSYHF